MMEYEFEKLDFNSFEEVSPNEFANKSIFTTKDWYDFLIKETGLTPIIIKIYREGKSIGYFYGGEIRKFGIKIIASPFSGWGTCWMGFDIIEGEPKLDIIIPLWKYLSQKCHYVYGEIVDRDFSCADIASLGSVK